jgi:hypothetical protein
LLVGAGILAGLVAGVLVGARTGLTNPADSTPSPAAPVAAGVVTESLGGSPGGWNFELPVFNASSAPVDVKLVSFKGANFALTSGVESNLAPGTWGTVPFSVVANCDVVGPGPMTSARLRVQVRGGSSVTAPPLPDSGSAVRGYHRAVCASADPVPTSELVGVWTVEKVYGPDTWLVGTRQIRFDRDGSFVTNRQDGLSSDNVGARGRYRLEGELLTVGVFRNDGCAAPSTATWRVTVRHDRMSMVWVHGVCPGGDRGDAWVLRRVLQRGSK